MELNDVIEFLKKNGYRDAEKVLYREAQLQSGQNSMTEELLSVRMLSDDEPFAFAEKYSELVNFVENSLDIYKMELAVLLYPVFVQLYLRLVAGSHLNEAQEFMHRFGSQQENIYQKDVAVLDLIRTPNDLGVGNEEMRRSEVALHESEHLFRQFHRSNFGLSMSRETYDYLQRHFLRPRALQTIHSIITEHLDVDVFDGPPRNQLMLECRRGAFFGEASKHQNQVKVLYGPLRDLDHAGSRSGAGHGGSSGAGGSGGGGGGGDLDGEDEAESSASRRKKARRDGQSTPSKGGSGGGGGGKGASDANTPSWDRIPLPQLKDADRAERRSRQRDLEKRLRLGPQTLPPVCLYTIANASTRGGCPVAALTEDGTKMAAGFEDGNIRIWSLTREPLRSLRPVSELERLSCDDPRIAERMLIDEELTGGDGDGPSSGGGGDTNDGSTSTFERQLVGHEGTVYGLVFSPDRQLLLSGGGDGDIRLWSLLTHSCLWVRREHRLPVWSVAIGPYGHYLASGGQDGLARLWSTDHNASLRLFAGHWSDVTAVEFHPNSNYLVTGSDDRGVRLFDIRDGKCVRLFCGHKGSPQTITFSPCGRYLVSGCDAGQVCVWDIATSHQVAYLRAHVHGKGTTALQLDRDGHLLATGGLDGSLRMWDFKSIVNDHMTKKASGAGMHHSSVVMDAKPAHSNTQNLLSTFYTRKTPIHALSFNRCNVLLGAGPFGQE